VEVGFVLRTLAQRADFVTAYFNSGKDMLLTRILDVDLKARRFIFDLSGHEASNVGIQKAEKVVFIAMPDGVRVQFSTNRIQSTMHEGQPALSAPFPPDLIKLQRREFFRLPTPLSSPYFCRLILNNDDALRLELRDISLGGAGMWFPATHIDLIDLGMKFPQVVFDLGPGGVIRFDIEVRNYRSVENRQGQTQYIVGVQFCNLSRSQEANLQKLISHLERERKALIG